MRPLKAGGGNHSAEITATGSAQPTAKVAVRFHVQPNAENPIHISSGNATKYVGRESSRNAATTPAPMSPALLSSSGRSLAITANKAKPSSTETESLITNPAQ